MAVMLFVFTFSEILPLKTIPVPGARAFIVILRALFFIDEFDIGELDWVVAQ